ncbi:MULTISPECIES: IclR family transcriptional regulator [unclassified Actinobaculum]|uniref:IclR family transcriptional regulator n=1 Tax=unclassified Actinobaculum TaxID=2609299 RepID=UPI0013DE5CDD|nr:MULTISPECIES: IclR family transcriptional regulator [unclassified Actinobaculum]
MASTKQLASVARALTILEYLARGTNDGIPLTTIAKDLKINKATAHSTLATLREREWVEQVPSTGHYRLGEGIRPLAEYRTARQRIVDDLHPSLVAISRRFNELVHLGALKGQHIVYLDKVEPDRAIRVVSKIGREASAVRTSLGRALIASQPQREESLPWYMSDLDLQSSSPERKTDIERAVRENFLRFDNLGWTEDIGEFEDGIACVAIPITINGSTDIAISISTPIERMSEKQRPLFARGMAEEIAKLPTSAAVSVPAALIV